MNEPYETPDVLVFGSRASENLGGQRRGFFDDFTGLATFAALFRQHQVPVFAGSEYTTWVDLNKFKLVFVEGDIQTQEAMDKIVKYAKSGGHVVLVGDAGQYTARNFPQRDYLKKTIGSLTNVRMIDDPERLEIPGVRSWSAPNAFNADEIDSILSWADVQRPAYIASDANPGYEAYTRRSNDGKHVYVSAMRSWYGWYRDRIEKKDVLRELFGMAKGTVTVNGLPDGTWKVTKFHRDQKDLGEFTATNGSIVFETDEAEAAEVQLYELTLVD